MRHEGIRNDEESVTQATVSDMKAVAQDMLRMGRHWARAAQDWLERAGDEAQRQASRTRADRDLQSDYSGGGYDQVDAARRRGAGYGGYGSFGTQAHGTQAYGAYAYDTGTHPGGRDYGGRDYRGVGPRNYNRSDERIREDLNERLTEAYDLDASGLTVEVANGVATLVGSVPQRWMKHRAEDLVDACIGVREVRNQIAVSGGTATAGGGTGRADSTGTGAGAGTGTATSAGAKSTSGGATDGNPGTRHSAT